MTTDFNEIFCEAVDVIVAQRLSEMKFDQTIVCTIVDNSKADKGCYTVTNDNLKFEAYSENTTYRRQQQVYVLIPQGDYSARKQILGKYDPSSGGSGVDGDGNEQEPGIEIIQPMDQIIPAGIIYQSTSRYGLKANGSKNNESKKTCTIFPTNGDKVENIDLSNYNALYIKAKFKAVTSNTKNIIKSGNYGLKILITTDTGQTYEAALDCQKDMNGNIYYLIDSQQQQVYQLNLADSKITGYEIQLYQNDNFYIDNNKTEYPTSDSNDIFVFDIEIGYGFNVINVENNTVKITSNDPITYKPSSSGTVEKKAIDLFYFNKNTNNKYIGFDDGKIDISAKTTGYVSGESSEKCYWIEWFRDNQDGTWKSMKPEESIQEFDKLDNFKKLEILSKVQLECNINLPQSSFKAVVYCNSQAYVSNVITFINENKVEDADDPDSSHLAFTLNHGNDSFDAYPYYGENNLLITPSEQYRQRQIYFTYESTIGALLDSNILDGGTMYWYIPKSIDDEGSTMLVADENWYKSKGYTKLSSDSDYAITGYDCWFKKPVDSNETDYNIFTYKINGQYFANTIYNTIKFRFVNKDGKKYPITSISFIFSSIGVYGTDYTFLIKEVNNKPAYTNFNYRSSNNNENKYELEAKLYNLDQKLINDQDIDLKYDLYNISGEANVRYNIAIATTTIPKPWDTSEDLIIKTEYPIPWSANENGDSLYYYQGPTTIIYDSAGKNPKYFNGALKLFKIEDGTEYTGISWNIVYRDGSDDSSSINPVSKIKTFFPQVVQTDDGIFSLKVPSVCTDDENIRICLIAKDKNNGNKVIWAQPIIIKRDIYENSLLNEWDGSLVIKDSIDGEGSYILSNVIGAGIKHETNNSFSGVVMGDVGVIKDSALTNKETGLFGYHMGSQVFAFKNDGTAFIGKEGSGRIEFDGTGGFIRSSNYSDTGGMSINLADGHIDAYNFKLTSGINQAGHIILINSNPTTDTDYYFKISGSDNAELSLNKSGRLKIVASEFEIIGAETEVINPNLLSETNPIKKDLSYPYQPGQVPLNTWAAYSAIAEVKSFTNNTYRGDYGFRCTYKWENTTAPSSAIESWGMSQIVNLTPGDYTFSALINAQTLDNQSSSSTGIQRTILIYAEETENGTHLLVRKDSENQTVYGAAFYIKHEVWNDSNGNKGEYPRSYKSISATFTVPEGKKPETPIKISIISPGWYSLISNVHINTSRGEKGKFWVYYPKLEIGEKQTAWVDKQYKSNSLETQFQELTDNGLIKGLIYQNNNLFINADYITTGILKSNNFAVNGETVTGGTRLDLTTGRIESANVDFTGKITANSGKIGHWEIDGYRIKNSTTIDGVVYTAYMQGFYVGTGQSSSAALSQRSAFAISITENGKTTYPVDIGYDGEFKATNAIIEGNITAKSGKIGGWDLSNGNLTSLFGAFSPDGESKVINGISENCIFRVSDTFSINAAGVMNCESARLGSWIFGTNTGVKKPPIEGVGLANSIFISGDGTVLAITISGIVYGASFSQAKFTSWSDILR